MNDMLDLILAHGTDPTQEPRLRQQIAGQVTALRASAGRGNPAQVAEAEEAVRAKPAGAFTFDGSGSATLSTTKNSWHAGRFETISIGELRDRARRREVRTTTPQVRLWVFDGASPVTDIGSLQATNGSNTLFQVASQFNCLESPGPHVTRVSNYFNDSTQGPRASISAFPGTLLRHYRAPGPDGERFVQETDGRQIDLLADVCGPGAARNGYFTGEGIADPQSCAKVLEAHFDAIRVGVHDEAQVVLGFNWTGAVEDSEHRRITQVFTSTVAGGGYGGKRTFPGEAFTATCRPLQRAAYLGTLLAAAYLGRTRVVLTLIGGGVFDNPIAVIWDAIQWALDEVEPFLAHDLDVIVNGYNLGSLIDLDKKILPAVRNRGGAILMFDNSGLVGIRR